jgi:mRNA-degrading endonuclease YafQ of YafQ-DinJ toxin-antitoxin module
MKKNLSDLTKTNYDFNQEIKNLISSINDNHDEIRKRIHETKTRTLLIKLIDEINFSNVFPDHTLKIKLAKKWNFYNRDPVSLTNFLIE